MMGKNWSIVEILPLCTAQYAILFKPIPILANGTGRISQIRTVQQIT